MHRASPANTCWDRRQDRRGTRCHFNECIRWCEANQPSERLSTFASYLPLFDVKFLKFPFVTLILDIGLKISSYPVKSPLFTKISSRYFLVSCDLLAELDYCVPRPPPKP